MNVIDCCIDRGIKRVVALSTDKASSPVNLYGATKLVSDKMFVAGNAYAGGHETRFAVVRYGNVMGSRGSVIPLFLSLKGQGKLPVTDAQMTRFMVSLEQGIELVWHALDDMEGGEIYVKKAPSIKVVDIARGIDPEAEPYIVGIRPGEKLHEQLISAEDSHHTFDYDGHFKIVPAIDPLGNKARVKDGRRVPVGFVYASNSNNDWMSVEALRAWIASNGATLAGV
jgi:FlaA1/EpsC-like NDP-sugar epimerase